MTLRPSPALFCLLSLLLTACSGTTSAPDSAEEAQLSAEVDKMFRDYQMGANKGDADAQYALGFTLINDGDVPNGLKYLKQAATNNDVLGEIALRSLPVFEQIIVNCPMGVTEVEFNRKLFLARRRAEQAGHRIPDQLGLI